MDRRLRIQVVEGHQGIVLVGLPGGDCAARDAAEQAVFHLSSRSAPAGSRSPPAEGRHAGDAGQVSSNVDQRQSRVGRHQVPHRVFLPRAELDHQVPAGGQVRGGGAEQRAQRIQAVLSSVERQPRLVVLTSGLRTRVAAEGTYGRLATMRSAPRAPGAAGRNPSSSDVTTHRIRSATPWARALRRATATAAGGDVAGDDARRRQLVGEGDGQASRPGPDVDDPRPAPAPCPGEAQRPTRRSARSPGAASAPRARPRTSGPRTPAAP